MEHFDTLMDMAEAEIKAVAKNGKFKTREEISYVNNLVDMVKNIYKIEEMCEEDEGSSYARGGRSYRSYPRYNDYDGGAYDDGMGMSYARGRGRNARRDSMGRYSRADGKDEFMDTLREAMDSAPDEKTRMSIQRMMSQME